VDMWVAFFCCLLLPLRVPLIARKLDLCQQYSVSFTINLYPDGTPLEKPDFLAIWLCNFFFISRIVKLPSRRVKLFAASFSSIFFLLPQPT
jgi:hypothetical protein